MSKKKQQAPEKKSQSKYEIKTSLECEQCKTKCESGKRYIELMKLTGFGKGVVCRGKV